MKKLNITLMIALFASASVQIFGSEHEFDLLFGMQTPSKSRLPYIIPSGVKALIVFTDDRGKEVFKGIGYLKKKNDGSMIVSSENPMDVLYHSKPTETLKTWEPWGTGSVRMDV